MRRRIRTHCVDCNAPIHPTPRGERCAPCRTVRNAADEKNRAETNLSKGLCCCGRVRKEGYQACAACHENSEKQRSRRRVHLRALNRKYIQQLKMAAFEAYGNTCACCGEDTIEFLQLDHVGGWGKDHNLPCGKRIKGCHLYIWLRDNNYPDTIRLLCGSCHQAITVYGACPHHIDVLDFILQNCQAVQPPTAS